MFGKKTQITGKPHETPVHMTDQGTLRTYCGKVLDVGWQSRDYDGIVYKVTCKECRKEYGRKIK